MSQLTHKGARQSTARPSDVAGWETPIATAPTEPEAFLRWAEQRPREEGKYELSRGRVTCTMINASSRHSRVVRNLVLELGRVIDLDRFEIGIADYAVRTPYGVRSPDILVERAKPRKALSTTTPILIVEVLSPSTEGVDFTDKLHEYGAVESLLTYVICSQDEPRAWLWARQADGAWPSEPAELTGRDGFIAPAGLGIELRMAAIFRGIPDTPPAA